MADLFTKLSFGLGLIGFLAERRERAQLARQLEGRTDPQANLARRALIGQQTGQQPGQPRTALPASAPPRADELEPPPKFDDECAALFTERRGPDGDRWLSAQLRLGTPGVSRGVPGFLASRSAEPVPGFLPDSETWRVVPLRDGAPIASAVLADRLAAGMAALGTLSLVLLPTGQDVTMVVVFCAPQQARQWSRSGDFAVLAMPAGSEPETQAPAAEVEPETAHDVAASPDPAATPRRAPPPKPRAEAVAVVTDAPPSAEPAHQNGASTRVELVPADVAPPPTHNASGGDAE